MNIVSRNFFRLLASGAFCERNAIEPMSAYKWQKLYQLALIHDVADVTWQGIERHREDFFMQLPETLLAAWQKSATASLPSSQPTEDAEENSAILVQADHLTNPLLNRKLQNILEDASTTPESRALLLLLVGTARFLMNKGLPVRLLIDLGTFLNEKGDKVDFVSLEEWLKSLGLTQMAQLAGCMLVQLLGFPKEAVPFMTGEANEDMDKMTKNIFRLTNAHAEEFYFLQGQDIFVHTANTSAMWGQVRRSARFFRYYPNESLTNFLASFAHSLSHIEE